MKREEKKERKKHVENLFYYTLTCMMLSCCSACIFSVSLMSARVLEQDSSIWKVWTSICVGSRLSLTDDLLDIRRPDISPLTAELVESEPMSSSSTAPHHLSLARWAARRLLPQQQKQDKELELVKMGCINNE